MIIQTFNFLPKRIVGQFCQWIFISKRAPDSYLFSVFSEELKGRKVTPNSKL